MATTGSRRVTAVVRRQKARYVALELLLVLAKRAPAKASHLVATPGPVPTEASPSAVDAVPSLVPTPDVRTEDTVRTAVAAQPTVTVGTVIPTKVRRPTGLVTSPVLLVLRPLRGNHCSRNHPPPCQRGGTGLVLKWGRVYAFPRSTEQELQVPQAHQWRYLRMSDTYLVVLRLLVPTA